MCIRVFHRNQKLVLKFYMEYHVTFKFFLKLNYTYLFQFIPEILNHTSKVKKVTYFERYFITKSIAKKP